MRNCCADSGRAASTSRLPRMPSWRGDRRGAVAGTHACVHMRSGPNAISRFKDRRYSSRRSCTEPDLHRELKRANYYLREFHLGTSRISISAFLYPTKPVPPTGHQLEISHVQIDREHRNSHPAARRLRVDLRPARSDRHLHRRRRLGHFVADQDSRGSTRAGRDREHGARRQSLFHAFDAARLSADWRCAGQARPGRGLGRAGSHGRRSRQHGRGFLQSSEQDQLERGQNR
ncbi:hypothetical protein ABIE73_003000 [Bradyrhizobium yuanmingense]